MEWQPTRFPGIAIKLLYRDADSGLFTALFRWEPGAVLPDHEHVRIEQTYMLEGSLVDEEGALLAGDFAARPAGSRHVARSPDGALILCFFLEPNRFFNADGTEERFSTAPAR
nr:cupin domain-containing protein [Roseomonas acroporae]